MWIEEAYGWLTAGPVTLQAGKIYSRLGLFWDNSFYGNIQAFDGLKVDPDYGLAVEGSLGERAGLAFAAQYFLVDGRTNISRWKSATRYRSWARAGGTCCSDAWILS